MQESGVIRYGCLREPERENGIAQIGRGEVARAGAGDPYDLGRQRSLVGASKTQTLKPCAVSLRATSA